MSGFQSPQLLTDLYRDLRDRRLLPLVLVLVVGLAVVPMALSSKPKSTPQAASPPLAAVAKKSNAPATEVVVSDPGLRDYQRRLAGETPQDPFAPAFAPSTSGTSGTLGDQSSASVPSSTGGAGTVTSSGTTTSTGGGSGSSPVVRTDTKLVFYRIKVRAGPVGGEMKTKDEVGPSVALPGEAVPALVFLGATFDSDVHAKRAYFLVSNSVSAISGDGKCSLGDPCQLLSIKPGEYVDLVWTDGLAYRVKLLAFKGHARDSIPGQLGADSGSGEGDSGSGEPG